MLSPQDPRSQSCVAEEGGFFPSALSFSFSFFLVLVATIGLVSIQPTLLWAHHFSHRQRNPCLSEAGLIPRCGSELDLVLAGLVVHYSSSWRLEPQQPEGSQNVKLCRIEMLHGTMII